MKWWFSDYDGTINVHHNDVIEKNDLDFINEWIRNGNKFVIASGRMNHEVQEILTKQNLNYDFIVTNNGACVYDKNNNLIEHLNIPMRSRKAIWELLSSYQGKYSMAYCLENKRIDLACVPTAEVDQQEFLAKYRPKTNNWEQGKKDILNNEALNLVFFYVDQKEINKIKNDFEKIPNVKIVATVANVLEVMHKDVSKAHGIDVIAKKFNLERDDVVVSGDGENDIEMLEYTPNSFVMDTAWDHVLNHGKHVIHRICEIKNYIKD